jgi:hypothetical protein
LLVASGVIPDIKFDFSQWSGEEQQLAVIKRGLYDCLKGESLLYTVVASGFQEAYTNLKPPIDDLSYLRPVIAVLYLVIAARFFMAAVERRKWLVFGSVLLAALVATGATYLSLGRYLVWDFENSPCRNQLVQLAIERMGDSELKDIARNAEKPEDEIYDVSLRAQGRTLIYTHHAKKPISDLETFHRQTDEFQKGERDHYCSQHDSLREQLKATMTHTFYNANGEWLTSFSISPTDCPE